MKTAALFFAGCILVAAQPAMAEAQLKFYPISPSAHVKPLMRLPALVVKTKPIPIKPAVKAKPEVWPVPAPKAEANGQMTEEQARQILSIYQVQN